MHPEVSMSGGDGEPQREADFSLTPDLSSFDHDQLADTDEYIQNDNRPRQSLEQLWEALTPLLVPEMETPEQFDRISAALDELDDRLCEVPEESRSALQCVLHLLRAMSHEYCGLRTHGDRIAREQHFVAAQADFAQAQALIGNAFMTVDLCKMFPGIDRITELMNGMSVRLFRHKAPPKNAS